MRPLALDLFCGAGGASMGLYRAGFDVIGVDIKKQPRYPFRFVRADALRPPFDLSRFDFIWASPPCQAFSVSAKWIDGKRKEHPNLIPQTRDLLNKSGVIYAIENVPRAPLRRDLVLRGPMFGGLKVLRERVFEMNFFVLQPAHRPSRSWLREGFLSVAGHGTPSWAWSIGHNYTVAQARDAMGIDWMDRGALSQAIPPAYGEFIGRAALKHIGARVAA